MAGDAANLVDPYLGEGIRYAIQSGRIAAEHCLMALTDGPDLLRGYDAAVLAAMGTRLEGFRQFIYPLLTKAPDTFYRIFIEQGGSMEALNSRMLQLAK